MKPDSVIDTGNAQLKTIFEKHKEFSEIERLIKLTEDVTSVDVETISASTSQMTAYLSNLAGVVPKYTSLANSHYIFRKFSLMWEFRKLGSELSIKSREQEALDKTETEHFEELVIKYMADYLKNKYDSYERHVSVLQSRLGILRNELFRANAD